MKKIVQISDELFWGFHSIIDIEDYSSFEELAIFMKNELISFLKYHNLLNLVIQAEKLNLHNHNYSNYKDLYDSSDDIIYLCGHC